MSVKFAIAGAAALAFGLLLALGMPELLALVAGELDIVWANLRTAAADASAARRAAEDAAASAATLAELARDGKVAPSFAELAAEKANQADSIAGLADADVQVAEQEVISALQAGDVVGAAAAAANLADAAHDCLVEADRLAILAQIPAINPTGLTYNCGWVAYAAYQVFGGDATAHALGAGGLLPDDIAAVVGGQFQDTTPQGIQHSLGNAANGSGGFVNIYWSGMPTTPANGYTHLLYVIQRDGIPYYVDGQTYHVETSLDQLYPNSNIDRLEWMPTF